ncbi:Hypothetical protein NTJ_10778 [Nesidiocoris tenuis]|uniref:Uncharacterized protein n=1 Tax=Nesidiocoris tenuis TaxID=355587 RepID=A0ABN7B0L4_9HEMI|nr:Hypothetical protein NTJ_10778 [Nesidiocoris tenuis]
MHYFPRRVSSRSARRALEWLSIAIMLSCPAAVMSSTHHLDMRNLPEFAHTPDMTPENGLRLIEVRLK